MGATHQWLAKPCDLQMLESTILRVRSLDRQLSQQFARPPSCFNAFVRFAPLRLRGKDSLRLHNSAVSRKDAKPLRFGKVDVCFI